MAKPTPNKVDFEKALTCPTCVFRRPEEVVEHPALTHAQKIDILQRWLSDATELSAAENEGMRGGDPAPIDAVVAALSRVENE